MATLVEYVLGLRDNMSPTIDGATKHVEKMEGALKGAKSMAIGVGSALGIAFGAFQIVSFVKEGTEKFHELEQVTAKVEANLKSTNGAAGLGMKEVQGYAKELSSHIQAGRSDILDMASQLLTFPAISKDIFQSSMGMVADIAKQTGHGLSETAIMYGKALNDPIDGLQKMMRYGVMFSDAEKEKIKKLQESNHLVEAQKAMMDAIAGSGYAGVAAAMFDADPIIQYNKAMSAVKLKVGEVATDLLEALSPALIAVANGFNAGIDKTIGFIDWMTVNKQTLTDVAVVIGTVTTALGVQWLRTQALALSWGYVAAAEGVYTFVTGLATAATWAWAAALWATGIPQIVIAVTALTVGVIKLTHHFGGFENMLSGVWEYIKAFGTGVGKVFMGIGEAIAGAMTLNPSLIAKGLKDTINAAKEAGIEMDKAWNNSDAQKATKSAEYAADYAKTKGKSFDIFMPNQKKDAAVKTGRTGAINQPSKTPATKAEGQKTVNIHIAYNAPLITGFTISTTNIKEGLGGLKEKVTAILTGATHDSLIIADS